jgi:GAF domain-containing protein
MGSLDHWQQELAGCLSLDEAMRVLASLCGDLPDFATSPVGISVRDVRGDLRSVSSDEAARRWETAQHVVGEGPVLDAVRERAQISTSGLLSDHRWPGLSDHLAGETISSVLATPLLLPGGATASLTLYAAEPGSFGEPERVRARHSAILLAGVLGAMMRYQEATAQIAHLSTALGSRTTIDQALGVLMAQNRCTSEQAFTLLTRASQNRNQKLRDLSIDILTSVSGRPPVPAPAFRWTPMAASVRPEPDPS